MFANHSVADVLRWINKGLSLLNQNDAMSALSAEHHLMSGFVSDQCDHAGLLAEHMPEGQVEQVKAWVNAVLNEVHFLDPLTIGTLQVRVAGDEEGKNILIDGGGTLAEIWYSADGVIESAQLSLARGLVIEGRDKLQQVLVGECSWTLYQAKELAQLLQASIVLASQNQWLSVEGIDQREVVIPEGASAVVEVGLHGSIKILWAEDVLAHSIKNDGFMEIFDCMSGLTPGRYSCAAYHYWEENDLHSDSYLVSEITGHKLLFREQSVVRDVGDQEWKVTDPGQRPAFSSREEEGFVLVRLHSGDILHPIHPCEVDWGALGLGTVAQYKLSRSTTAHDLTLTRRLHEVFEKVQSKRPFLVIHCSYSRSEDWVIDIEDLSPSAESPLKVVVCHTDHMVCYSLAIQQLLSFAGA
ncbi:hypothetical protein [Pseudomonas amygdali]|uniref:hypothetical protein n=1 Tax=Pseudomonas amygdali TaxID=47877 RepID=UPI000A58405A|nr:hypothetical protein [Pseudomonas amygdali]